MKKLIFLLILPLFLGLVFSGCTCWQKQAPAAPAETAAPPPVVKEEVPPPAPALAPAPAPAPAPEPREEKG